MAFVAPRDRVLESSTTAGSGPWEMGGAVDPSYNAFADFMSVGDWTIGAVVEPGQAYAAGELTLTDDSSGNPELTLTATYASHGTFSTGTKQIFMGFPASLAFGRAAVADANYAQIAGIHLIAYTSLSASRIVSLLAAAAFPPATRLLIVDESGSCSGSKTIALAAAGSDTINGQTGGTAAVIDRAYGYLILESDGVGKWTIIAGRSRSRAAVNDANYNVETTDRIVAFTAISAARTINLPAAASFPNDQQLIIVDESGGVSATNHISMARAGSDTINGGSSAKITGAFGYLVLEGNGSNAWTIVGQDLTSAVAALPSALPGAIGVTWNDGGIVSTT